MNKKTHMVCSGNEFELIDMICCFDEKLPFELHKLKCNNYKNIECYDIPDESKQQILDMMYPFEPTPSLDDEMFDIHELKTFNVRDFKVVRKNKKNYIVSPYFHLSGGTIIGWMKPCIAEECYKFRVK